MARDVQDRRGAGEHRSVTGLDEDAVGERASDRLSGDETSERGPLKRREGETARAVAGQNELHRAVAEGAMPVVKDNLGLGVHGSGAGGSVRGEYGDPRGTGGNPRPNGKCARVGNSLASER